MAVCVAGVPYLARPTACVPHGPVLQVAEISASIVDVRAAYALLSEFKVQLSRDRLELEWEAYRGPQRIAIKMAEVGTPCAPSVPA
jgi:hypothetical protein